MLFRVFDFKSVAIDPTRNGSQPDRAVRRGFRRITARWSGSEQRWLDYFLRAKHYSKLELSCQIYCRNRDKVRAFHHIQYIFFGWFTKLSAGDIYRPNFTLYFLIVLLALNAFWSTPICQWRPSGILRPPNLPMDGPWMDMLTLSITPLDTDQDWSLSSKASRSRSNQAKRCD